MRYTLYALALLRLLIGLTGCTFEFENIDLKGGQLLYSDQGDRINYALVRHVLCDVWETHYNVLASDCETELGDLRIVETPGLIPCMSGGTCYGLIHDQRIVYVDVDHSLPEKLVWQIAIHEYLHRLCCITFDGDSDHDHIRDDVWFDEPTSVGSEALADLGF